MVVAAQLKASKVQPTNRQSSSAFQESSAAGLTADSDNLETVTGIGAKSVRMTLVLPPKSSARLERLKEVTEAASYAEIIRNAIRVYEALVMEHDSGTKFFVKRKDGKDESVEYKIF